MNIILKLIIAAIIGALLAHWVNLEYNKWRPKDEWKPVESQTLKDNLHTDNLITVDGFDIEAAWGSSTSHFKENWRKDYETTLKIEKDDIKILDWRNKK